MAENEWNRERCTERRFFVHYITFLSTKRGEHTLSVAVVVVGLLKREMEKKRIVDL